ncbi:MAG: recombinase family protein [Candidatus Scatovivens sp.]
MVLDNETKYSCALYCRLSNSDDLNKESQSITNQKELLEKYAKENDLNVYDIYIDDGYSGTNFNRPDFHRMIKDIENKKVNMVIVKDSSRLGRDYIRFWRIYRKIFSSKQYKSSFNIRQL